MKYSKYWIIVASKLLLIWQEIFYSACYHKMVKLSDKHILFIYMTDVSLKQKG